MSKKILKNKIILFNLIFILSVVFLGIFAEYISPNDPLKSNILNKFARYSFKYPLGTDHLGRCVFSRIIYGIRPTFFLAFLTMIGTIGIGLVLGLISGYFKGWIDEIIMRVVDIMLSFPSQIMILAIVALLGVDIINVIIANVFIKWAWYARMIRTNVIKYSTVNFVLFSRSIGQNQIKILIKHILPNIASELAILASLDMGWAILNISTLSFLGLGVQAPTPEWGAMLNEAKNVLLTNPTQMLAPGIAIILLVSSFNFLGDSMRDLFDPKEGEKC